MVVFRVHGPGKLELLYIRQALGRLRQAFGFGQSGQQHSSKNGDDGDHDEQLDEREAVGSSLREM